MSQQADHSSLRGMARYLVALGAVAIAFALRVLLTPLTGTGAPFVLFFAAVLVTSLYAGTGPGLVALVASLPIAAYMFVVRAGYPVDEAVFQALLYAMDGLMLSGSILRGPDNAPLYYIAQVEDIAERKLVERALRHSEAKFSGIVSIAADAIISVDANRRITVFNEGAERIFGYSKREMIGTFLDRLLPERYRTEHTTSFAAFAASDTTARTMAERREVYGLRKSGEWFPAEASISKVTVGSETFFSVVLRDITSRKSVEEALERALVARDEVLGIVAHDRETRSA